MSKDSPPVTGKSRRVREWKTYLNGCLTSGKFPDFAPIYGTDGLFIRGKVSQITRALDVFEKKFSGDPAAYVVRVPGRINMMGRHVDHQGGSVNVVAIPREVVFVAAARADGNIEVINVDDKEFPARNIPAEEIKAAAKGGDWGDFLSTDDTKKLRLPAGDWGNAIKGAALRVQHRIGSAAFKGANVAVFGNIPSAAGLSASSALIMGFVESFALLHDLKLSSQEVVDLSNEAEWFLGSREGASDHAAIKQGKLGQITRLDFFPFKLGGHIKFFPKTTLLIGNTGIRPSDPKVARIQFNSRLLCYEVGKHIFKETNSDVAPEIAHLRDINPETLQQPLGDFYARLKKVPEFLSDAVLGQHFPPETARALTERFGLQDLQKWPLRGILVYGIAECARSNQFQVLAQNGDVTGIGKLMDASHDGDRVVRWGEGKPAPWSWNASDAALDELASSTTPLYTVPGIYGCSIPEIDFLVDECKATKGVYGAQLSGGGLGGCMVALTREETILSLKKKLEEKFTAQFNRKLGTIEVKPLQGGGPL